MPGVAGGFLQQVRQDPSQVGRGQVVELIAVLVQASGTADHGIDVALDLLVPNDRRFEAGRVRVIANCNAASTEAGQDPGCLCVCEVVDEPEKRCA